MKFSLPQPSLLKPDIVMSSIDELTHERMQAAGVTHIIFDVDDTLVPDGGDQINEHVASHLAQLGHDDAFKLFLASNSRRDLTGIAGQIGAKVIRSTRLSRKPRRTHFRRILAEAGCEPGQAAMVGDRLLIDILGGNLAGMTTVLVPPVAGLKRRFRGGPYHG